MILRAYGYASQGEPVHDLCKGLFRNWCGENARYRTFECSLVVIVEHLIRPAFVYNLWRGYSDVQGIRRF